MLAALRVLAPPVRRVEELGGSVAASHYREGNPEKEVIRSARSQTLARS
jgi:hypothetical protein